MAAALLNHSIYSYDLKYASTIIWGDAKVTELIPSMTRDLRSYEIVTLFYTAVAFLGVLDNQSFQHGLSGERVHLQSAKPF